MGKRRDMETCRETRQGGRLRDTVQTESENERQTYRQREIGESVDSETKREIEKDRRKETEGERRGRTVRRVLLEAGTLGDYRREEMLNGILEEVGMVKTKL